MYEVVMHGEKNIVVVTNIESGDLGYIVARGRENNVNVRVCDSFIFEDEFVTHVLQYIPITCVGTEEDLVWFFNDIRDLTVSFAAA